jgi:hypothetical protein
MVQEQERKCFYLKGEIFMKKFLIFSLFFLVLFIISFSQEKNSAGFWQSVYGGEKSEKGYGIVKGKDGYILVGETSSFGNGGKDVYIIKIDRRGKKIWEKAYGGPKDDYAYSICKAKDGYIIVGGTRSFGAGNSDVFVLKINEDGDLIWQKTFGDKGFEEGWRITKDYEGNFLVVGRTNSFGKGQYDIYLLKIDDNGNKLWEKAFGDKMSEYGYGVVADKDGYVAIGISNSFSESQDIYVIKVDKKGNLIWDKVFGGKGFDYAYDVTSCKEGYVIVGNSNSFSDNTDLYVIKINKNGEKIWEKVYGGKGYDTGFFIMPSKDKMGYLIVGGSNSKGAGNSDVYVVKIDENGDLLWERFFGGADLDEGWGAIYDLNYLVIVGRSESFSTANSELYVVRFRE